MARKIGRRIARRSSTAGHVDLEMFDFTLARPTSAAL
jgi:hypothetical protein